MLIPSTRHGHDDLALWRNLELADRLNYRLRRVEDKAQRSLAALAGFLRGGPCYVSISWGKDSTVTAHLLWRLIQAGDPYAALVPCYRVRMEGLEPPGTDEVEAAFLARFPLPYARIDSPHDPAWLREEGKRSRALAAGLERCAALAGTRRWVGGLRAEESTARRLGARKGCVHGIQCSPLTSWCVVDVFAYLAHHALPVHPNYGMLGGGFWERQHLRVSMLANHRGRGFGRLRWEQWYYGDVLDAMRARHPNMVPW